MRSKGFSWLIVCAFAASEAVAAPGVEVSTDRLTYDGGDITVVVTNRTRSALFLPSCGAVVLERFDGERYEPLPPPPCEGEREAVRLKAGESRSFSLRPPAEGRQLVRPVVTYGAGCRAGAPLPQAECRDFGDARGRYVSWAPEPEPEP